MYADVKGHILQLSTDIVVVPYQVDEHGWYCVVVKGLDRYSVGGYNIHVDHQQLMEAKRIEV